MKGETTKLDLRAVHGPLRDGRATDAWMASWLTATWSRPDAFREMLYGEAWSRPSGAIKSRPDTGLDFYADCVASHLGRARVALVTSEADGTSTSFDALHDRCSALASSWRRTGLEAGQCVGIVLPVGLEYAVALLAALRLGLVVAAIPPLGPAYVRSCLGRLEPDHLVTTGRYKAMLPPEAPEPLAPTVSGGDVTFAGSHAYAKADVVLQVLSPFGDPAADPIELAASEVHESLVRDGFLVWALDATDRMAVPGCNPAVLQPLALLTAWVSGSAWVEIDPADIETKPRILKRLGVTVLGVTAKVRETILAGGADVCGGVQSWFRLMNDVFDYTRWDRLAALLAEKSILSFSVLTNVASGGAHLFTPRARAHQGLRVWPVPGRAWQLSQVGAGMLPSVTDSGVYTALRGEEADRSLPRVVMAKQGDGYVLGGSIDVGPQARALPAREIAVVAERSAGVRAASLVIAPGRFPNDAFVVLLVFTDSERGADGQLVPDVPAQDVRASIAREMGECHVPDRVEVFPLYPRFKDGVVDAAWCRSQYLSGTLTAKVRMPLFLTLARLSWIFGKAA